MSDSCFRIIFYFAFHSHFIGFVLLIPQPQKGKITLKKKHFSFNTNDVKKDGEETPKLNVELHVKSYFIIIIIIIFPSSTDLKRMIIL